MTKQITKIELDGKIIGTKPLLMDDNLFIVREKIKQKVDVSYIFLDQDGNNIEQGNEKDYTLKDISLGKIIKLKSYDDKNVKFGINIFLNDKKIFNLVCKIKNKLNKIRKLIFDKIKVDFIFLDSDGNTIDKEDEKDYSVEDILSNETNELKGIHIQRVRSPKVSGIMNQPKLSNSLLNKKRNMEMDIEKISENEKENDVSKLVSVYLDNNQFTVKKLKLNNSLDIIRKNIGEKVLESSFFTLENGDKIEIADESGITLQDILIENKKIFMISNKKPGPIKIEKNTPIEGSEEIGKIGHLKIYKYPNIKLSDIEESSSISLLVVGQTGSGKTTLLNAFINALMDIKITYDFRYKIIVENFNHSQAFSMTKSVNIYNIKPHGNIPAIKIIDTPGFGDTSGIAQDKIIRDQIADTFMNKLNTINAICFVAQSSNARLTINQKYIFTSILDLFGKDVQENFVAMLTFCDGKEPRIIDALQEKGSIFDKIIPHIKGNWYYKFNNSAIYSDDINDEFTQMFWKLGMKSFQGFIDQLIKIPRKSLTQSKEVLKER